MCRFLAYSGESILMEELVFNTGHSLIQQSKNAKMLGNPLNGDGCGLGWYPEHDDPLPGTFISIEPAWNNRNLFQLASKIKSSPFFAHVRDASPDMPVSQSNCHPFQYQHLLWMHNGNFDEFPKFKRMLLNSLSDQAFEFIQGNTDSEYAFAVFLDEINFDSQASLSKLKQAMRTTINKINQFRAQAGVSSNALINFALTNGQHSLFTRYSSIAEIRPASLFYKQTDKGVIVSSEPLQTCKTNWIKVERNTLVSVEGNQVCCETIF